MYLNTREVMERYSISRATLFRWERDGKIPKARNLHNLKRWNMEELEKWESRF